MKLVDILSRLISFPSITPQDSGCQAWMMDYLQALGFQCQMFNNDPVANFYASIGDQGPLLVFAGHTDVVPVGEASQWHTDPFKLELINDVLFGRGVADMKGSLAAMLVMAERVSKQLSDFHGRLGFLITSGEEGDHFDQGTPYVMAELARQGIEIDYCIVGEPSSTDRVGDVVKVGRRGSLTGNLTVQGQQGHVAYPHLAKNPIHLFAPVLTQFCQHQWDSGNAYFPPTSMQITHIDSGGHAGNVIPGRLDMQFNFRFSTEQTQENLQAQTKAFFDQMNLPYSLDWRLNGNPFLTEKGCLIDAAVKQVQALTGLTPQLSTSGGTSDARFIAPYGVEVIELGPVNASIHQVNEQCLLADLHQLSDIYLQITRQLLS